MTTLPLRRTETMVVKGKISTQRGDECPNALDMGDAAAHFNRCEGITSRPLMSPSSEARQLAVQAKLSAIGREQHTPGGAALLQCEIQLSPSLVDGDGYGV